jgi:tRNA threonylcarbamoyl adenosine modification protein YjeE
VRGFLRALGVIEPVRSPTFGLIQTFDTEPPVMHADLYRLESWAGIGLEEYLEDFVCLIEWPDRARGLIPVSECTQVRIQFAGSQGRDIQILNPGEYA